MIPEPIHPFEYTVELSNGQKLEISEFDPEVFPQIADVRTRDAVSNIMSRCSYVPRTIMEDAKRGYDTHFTPLIRTPPIGGLLRVIPDICDQYRECAMYKPGVCTTNNISNTGGNFPECWTVRLPFKTPKDIFHSAASLGTSVVHAWRQGRLVVMINLKPGI